MFREFYAFITEAILEPLQLTGEGIALAMFLLLPFLLGLLAAWGSWRAVFIACAIWYGGLLLVFLLETLSSTAGNGAYAALTFGFFFSVLAVPFLSFIVKRILVARGRSAS
jgi:hypothetical protein